MTTFRPGVFAWYVFLIALAFIWTPWVLIGMGITIDLK